MSGTRGKGSYSLPQPWACKQCGGSVDTARKLAPHIRLCCPHLEVTDDAILRDRVTRCGSCHKVYGKGTALQNHSARCNPSSRAIRNQLEAASSAQAALSQEARVAPPPHPPLAAGPLPPSHLDFLAVRGVFKIPRTCIVSMGEVTQRFFQHFSELAEEGTVIPESDISAFFALPDIFLESKTKKQRASQVAHLQSFRTCPSDQLCDLVLHTSRQIRSRLAPPKRHHSGSSLPTTRLRYLVSQNCPGKAARLIQSHADKVEVADLSDQGTREETQALFPPASVRDNLPVGDTANPPTISPDSLDSCIRSLPRQSANGLSSWTYDLIKQIGTDNRELSSAILRFLHQVLLQGKAGDAKIWTRSRGIVLRKKDGGPRPIAIGEAWMRVFARLLAGAVSSSIGPILAPLQWGIGIPGGAEIVAHMGSLFGEVSANEPPPGDPRLAIQQVDFANAFNTVGRSAIFDGLHEYAPSLQGFFRWSYGGASPIYSADGSILCVSATGVRQGDPLGPLFFCAALQPILVRLQQKYPSTFFPSYMDDIHVMGREQDMEAILNDVEEWAAPIGLHLKREKCHILSIHPLQGDVARDGIICLGTPVGSARFMQQYCKKQFGAFQRPLQLLPQLEAPVAFPILQACINTRPTYLARTVFPPVLSEDLLLFDQAVDQTLGAISGFSGEVPQVSSEIRSLPSALGGLSVRKLEPIASRAWAASRAHACFTMGKLAVPFVKSLATGQQRAYVYFYFQYLHDLLPQFVRHLPQDTTLPFVGERYLFASWIQQGDLEAMVAPPRQKALTDEFDKQQFELLSESLVRVDPFGASWVLSNRFKGSSRFLSLGENPAVTLSAAAVQANLRLRLLLPAPASSSTAASTVQCTACGGQEADAEVVESSGRLDPRFHGLVCRKGQGLRTDRHNAVTRVVAAFLVRAFGAEHVSTLEPDLRLGGGTRKADIRVQCTQGHIFFDISVVHPACDKYVNGRASASSCDTPLAAADRMFQLKRDAGHAQFLGRAAGALPVCFPVVFETTGNLCRESAAFLSEGMLRLGVRAQFQGASVISNFDWMLRRCRTIIAESNYKAVTSFFHNSRSLLGQDTNKRSSSHRSSVPSSAAASRSPSFSPHGKTSSLSTSSRAPVASPPPSRVASVSALDLMASTMSPLRMDSARMPPPLSPSALLWSRKGVPSGAFCRSSSSSSSSSICVAPVSGSAPQLGVNNSYSSSSSSSTSSTSAGCLLGPNLTSHWLASSSNHHESFEVDYEITDSGTESEEV